jgi:hypothetical protein
MDLGAVSSNDFNPCLFCTHKKQHLLHALAIDLHPDPVNDAEKKSLFLDECGTGGRGFARDAKPLSGFRLSTKFGGRNKDREETRGT